MVSFVILVITQIPTNGLVAYYSFNGNANDESGNGNHGIVHGATSTSDKFSNPNSAYWFDGIDDYIQLPISIIDGQEGTISCWIQIADTIYNNAIFGTGDTTNSHSTFGFYVCTQDTKNEY